MGGRALNETFNRLAIPLVLALGLTIGAKHPAAFCVRNDTGTPIQIDATDDGVIFSRKLANNKKACCDHTNTQCTAGEGEIDLSISSTTDDSNCLVTVPAKGNVNVTGRLETFKCKALKAGSTMDWASG